MTCCTQIYASAEFGDFRWKKLAAKKAKSEHDLHVRFHNLRSTGPIAAAVADSS